MTLNLKYKLIVCLPILMIAFSLLAGPVLALTVSETGLETTAREAELPETDLTVTIGRLIGIAFSLVGVIFFLLLLYGGFLWMTARGNEENVKKARDLLTAAIIGLIIVVAGYTISSFVIGALLDNQIGAPEAPVEEGAEEKTRSE